jgi:RNase adaptor protein for sRNA GlmZ degradation
LKAYPIGLKNIQILSDRCSILNELAELRKVLNALANSKKLSELYKMNVLRVTIKSFSYKRGIPYDNSGNGGGHVFDCRFINNPGRIDKYKDLCGKDKEVIQFIENQNETEEFFNSIKLIVSKHISVYNQRNFSHLAVNFGCTGGRHRSVFFAEKTAEYLKNRFNIHVELIHTEGF